MALAPLIRAVALQRTRALALVAMTEAIQAQSEAAGANDYSRLVQIQTDQQGRATLLVTDTQLLNRLTAAVTLDAAERLERLSRQTQRLPLGVLLWSNLLPWDGPPVSFRFAALGAPEADLEDSFTGAGLNQTRHSIYLRLSCRVRMISPFAREECTVETTMLLAEGVIVGYVPESYWGTVGE